MLQAGVARTCLTPYWGVELTGWGYYIERKWRRIHDHLYATALVIEDGERQAVIVALDLMVIDAAFTRATRDLIHAATGIPTSSILLNCSHSHNAPAAGGLLGVGECDPVYEEWAAHQAATAAILAWQQREQATIKTGHTQVGPITFNRTRTGGAVDSTLTVLGVDRPDESPLAVVVNFGAHPTVTTELRPWDVGRDVPGMVCDGLESASPGVTALYLQGACGDVNFLREFSTPEEFREPAQELIKAALVALDEAETELSPTLCTASEIVELETRAWERSEIEQDRREAERRLSQDDTSHWRETIGRSMTNRPDDMVKRHGGNELKAVRAMCRFNLEWTEKMLRDFESRPLTLSTEVQTIRLGDLSISANSSELFTPFALDVRARAKATKIMFACYSNGAIGYLPDEHDINLKSYAGYQSPKYLNQFPFTARSGSQMCDAILRSIETCRVVQ